MAQSRMFEETAVMLGGLGRNGAPPGCDRRLSTVQTSQSRAPDQPCGQKPTRRQFTAEYKLRILNEADLCTRPGQLGALLVREGLYSSHLSSWRRQREEGMRAALAPRKRGRKPAKPNAVIEENQWLRRENDHLLARLRQAEMIIQMQSKVSDATELAGQETGQRAGRLIGEEPNQAVVQQSPARHDSHALGASGAVQ